MAADVRQIVFVGGPADGLHDIIPVSIHEVTLEEGKDYIYRQSGEYVNAMELFVWDQIFYNML